MPFAMHRRRLLTIGVGAAVATAWMGSPRPAFAAKNDAEELIKKFTGGKTATEGRVRLDLPEIAENGNTVPFTITVDSPMTDKDHVKAIHIIATSNPQPGVATFRLSPISGKAAVASRMRLQRTQDVIGIAELSDGRFLMTKRPVKVTIGGCGG